MKKYIVVLISILCLSFIITSYIYKTDAVGLDILQNPNNYIQSSEDNTGVIKIGNIIVWVVRTVGQAIAVVMLLVIGIKYILGSVEEKAEYKQSMWPYILGAVLIFAGTGLVDIIYKAFVN